MRQYNLFPGQAEEFHGGEVRLGKRKILRPLARKRAIHFVLKAKQKIYPHRSRIEKELQHWSDKFGLRVYDRAVGPDHVHFVVKIPGRQQYLSFIRALTSALTGFLGKNCWKLLPFSRVLHWGKDFLQVKKYLQKNRDEASGKVTYEPRRDWYKYKRPK